MSACVVCAGVPGDPVSPLPVSNPKMIPRVEGKIIAMMIAMMVPPTPRWMRPNPPPPPPPVACSTFLLERPFFQSIALLLARREPASHKLCGNRPPRASAPSDASHRLRQARF
jgi:hypothetical protein